MVLWLMMQVHKNHLIYISKKKRNFFNFYFKSAFAEGYFFSISLSVQSLYLFCKGLSQSMSFNYFQKFLS